MSSASSPATSTLAAPTSFTDLDNSKPNRFQMKIMFVSGMGFFTDAYDLFVIGVVVSILKVQWNLSTEQTSLLSSLTLAASAIGAILFGRVADIFGRKKMYGVEVLILAAGAIASAFAPSITWLIIFRIILGVGVGGDYPVSATIMSEYAGKQSRGKMVSLVFANQAAGLVIGPLIAYVLLAAGVDHNLVWRLLLGLGAIPGLAVFYLRRQIHETPRFAAAAGDQAEVQAAVADATGASSKAGARGESKAILRQSMLGGFTEIVRNPRLLRWLIGAAVAWAALDFTYYGNTIASPEIVGLIKNNVSLTGSTLITLLIFVVFAVPGYVVAILNIDRLGRKTVQIGGFSVMALMFGLIGAIPGVTSAVVPFLVLYGISFFFYEFGPNTTTFVYPAEIFPVEVRTTGHGIAAGMGKMGGFAGVYLFQTMLASWGIRGTEGVAAGVAMIGLAVTFLLPEPKSKSLEELTATAYAKPASLVPASSASVA